MSQKGTVERVCEVCSAVGPAHLQIEGSRLLAAIVKNCQESGALVEFDVKAIKNTKFIMYLFCIIFHRCQK